MINRLAYSFAALAVVAVLLSTPASQPVQARSLTAGERADVAAVVGAAHADDSIDTGSIRSQLTAQDTDLAAALTAYKAAKAADKLNLLKSLGDKATTVRTGALTALTNRVNTGFCSKIDPTVKSLIIADISAVQNNITTAKTKVDADTDLTTTKTDVQTVYSANRVFAHFIPAVMGICTSQTIIDLVNNKVTPLITQLKTSGKDTAQLSTDAAATKTAASDALALYEKVAANPGANTTNNSDLQTANTDLAKARADLAQVKADLEALKDTSSSTTPAPTTSQ